MTGRIRCDPGKRLPPVYRGGAVVLSLTGLAGVGITGRRGETCPKPPPKRPRAYAAARRHLPAHQLRKVMKIVIKELTVDLRGLGQLLLALSILFH